MQTVSHTPLPELGRFKKVVKKKSIPRDLLRSCCYYVGKIVKNFPVDHIVGFSVLDSF